MEIRLGTIKVSDKGEQKIEFGELLSPKNFDNLQKNISELELFRSHNELHAIFIINFLELSQYFQNVVNDLTKESITALKNTTPEFRMIYRNSNRLLFNLLSSGRTLIDHQETYLKKEFGKESQEIINFKSVASKVFDSSFEYRFIYKLRNYAQHCGFPINRIEFKSKNERQGYRQHTRTNLNPLFDKYELLNKFDGWGKIVENDIKNQPDQFPVMCTIGKYYEGVDIINSEFVRIELTKILNPFLELKTFLEKFGDIPEGAEPCVFYDFQYSDPNSYENLQFKNQLFPLDLINEIEEKLKTAKNTPMNE